jgi:hypothetical protein
MRTENRWREQYLNTGSYEHEIARGNVRGAYPYSAYGKLTTSGAVTDVLVRDDDGTTLVVPQGVQLSLVSTSANDAAAGTGARTVVVEYLNGDLDYSFEMVALNGTTPVLTLATDVRWVQAVHVATAGSGGKAAGDITATNGGVTYLKILVGERTTHNSFTRVPRQRRLFVTQMYAGASSGSSASRVKVEAVSTQINGLDQSETGLFYKVAGIALQDGSATLALTSPFPVNAGQIFGFVATSDKAATITTGYMGWIE